MSSSGVHEESNCVPTYIKENSTPKRNGEGASEVPKGSYSVSRKGRISGVSRKRGQVELTYGNFRTEGTDGESPPSNLQYVVMGWGLRKIWEALSSGQAHNPHKPEGKSGFG